MEHLSDASFLDKLLVLLANVRLDWKEIARYKYFNLFGLNISNKEKSFIKTMTPGRVGSLRGCQVDECEEEEDEADPGEPEDEQQRRGVDSQKTLFLRRSSSGKLRVLPKYNVYEKAGVDS